MLLCWGTWRTQVCRYNWHSAGSLRWPFPMLKYKYIFHVKYTEAILSDSTQKLLWFEITKVLITVLKNKVSVLFIVIFGSLSFLIRTNWAGVISWSLPLCMASPRMANSVRDCELELLRARRNFQLGAIIVSRQQCTKQDEYTFAPPPTPRSHLNRLNWVVSARVLGS